jgi:hypothetical protein
MADLGPDLAGKLARLLPRLASDAPGEVHATAQAIKRTLDRAGLDLHDLAARLTEAPRPVQPGPARPAQHHAASRNDLAMALWLAANALDRLTARQAEFVETAARLLIAGRALTPKQSRWLADLHAQHAGHEEH